MVKHTTISTDEASFPHKRGAAIDAKKRNDKALADNPTFFNDPARQSLYNQLEKLIGQYYSITDRRFTNYRPGGNGHKPAIAIKISNPSIFRTKLSKLLVDIDQIDPNIELKENTTTGSHIYEIY